MLLNVRRWISTALRLRQGSPALRRDKASFVRPRVEALEDRLAPATWTGAVSNLWSVAGNWSGGQPTAGAALIFPAGAANPNTQNDIPGNRLFSSITLADTNYNLGGNAIQLSGGIQDTAGAGGNTIQLNIALTHDQTFAVSNSDGLLHMQGSISGPNGITKSGAGTLFYEGVTANSYSGATGTMVNAGTLVLDKAASLALASKLTIGAGTSVQYGASPDQIANTASVIVNNFGTLILNGQSDAIASLTLAGGSVDTGGAGLLTLGGNLTTLASAIPALISGNLDLGGAVRTVTVGQGAAGDDLIITANVSDGGLNKMGLGKLVLSANNTYNGVTTVSAGTLEVQNSNALGTSIGGTSVVAGATLQITKDGLAFSDALTLNGNGVGNLGALRFLSSGGNSNWDGNIILPTNARVSVNSDTVGTLVLDGIISGAGGLTKVGNSTLEIGGTQDNTFTGTTSVTAGALHLNKTGIATIAVHNLVIGDGIGSDTVQLINLHQIFNTSSVTVNSSGLLDLNGNNDVIGFLTLTGGAVNTGGSTLVLGGSLTLTGGSVSTGAGSLVLGGNIVSNAFGLSSIISGNLDLNNATRTVTVANGAAPDDLIIAAVVSNGSLTKAGAGKLDLQGANTYAGTTLVSAGTLSINDNSALGTTVGGTTVAAGASLVIAGGASSIAENLTLNGTGVAGAGALQLQPGTTASWTGNVILGSATSINVPLAFDSLSITTGVISGASTASLSKIGPGLLILAGTNTYAGGTAIIGGTLSIRSDAALGTSAGGTTVVAGASLNVDATAGDINLTEKLTLNGNGQLGAGALQATGDNSVTMSGAIVLPTTSLVRVDGITELDLAGLISGAGGLNKIGIGTLGLLGNVANTYTGTTTVSAGTLTLNKTGVNAITTPLVVLGTVTLNAINQIADTVAVAVNGGLLDLNGFNETIGSLSMSGGNVATSAGTLTLKGNIVSNPSAASSTIAGNLNFGGVTRTVNVIEGPAPDDLVISASISNGGLTKMGLGRLVLSGLSNYAGATTVSGGTLAVLSNSALGTPAGATTVMAGATLSVEADGLTIGENLALNGLGQFGAGALQKTSGAGTSTWTGNVVLSTTAAIGASPGNTLSVTGIVSGAATASLVKVGGGTVALGTANAYAGTTNINAGTLAATNVAGSATGTGIVSVNNNGTLAGNGKVGNVVVRSGGTLAPSTDPVTPAVLTTGSVYFNIGATFFVIIDSPAFSQLNALGTVTINAATLNVFQVTAGALNDTYTIINNDNADNVLGTFAVFGGDFNPNYSIAYNAAGNDVVLTQIV